jgi:hypothetical protein
LEKDVEQYPDNYQNERAQRLTLSRQRIAYALNRLSLIKKPLNIQKQTSKLNRHLKLK